MSRKKAYILRCQKPLRLKAARTRPTLTLIKYSTKEKWKNLSTLDKKMEVAAKAGAIGIYIRLLSFHKRAWKI